MHPVVQRTLAYQSSAKLLQEVARCQREGRFGVELYDVYGERHYISYVSMLVELKLREDGDRDGAD